jgi:uncharacterized protein (DUF2236 family)
LSLAPLAAAPPAAAVPAFAAPVAAAPAFTPDLAIWTVHRELALLLGAGRALLLQLAHPLVAAGVADHSRFARDPIGRLLATLGPMYTLVFGSPAATTAAAEGLRRVHRRVHGVLTEGVGVFPVGAAYDADDPELRLWVHATLIDSSLRAYTRFVRPLSARAAAEYYAGSCELARRLDVPPAVTPPTLEAFDAYVAEMLASGRIAVGATARAQARLVFRPPAVPALRVIAPAVELVTAGLLPPAVREMYGYAWSPARERALRGAAALVRRVLPLLPARVRVAPHARRAERARI